MNAETIGWIYFWTAVGSDNSQW